jgi:ABC-type amino acid transport substrate-binding protein
MNVDRRGFLMRTAGAAALPLLSSCASLQGRNRFLRVGITPDYPPMAFRQGEHLAGVEVDLAMDLGRRLNKRVQFIMLRWDEQIPSLLDGRIDIIMSGMSITDARMLRIDFSDPYFTTGLMALMRWRDVHVYKSADDILNCTGRIGVKTGTQGAKFLDQNIARASKALYEIPLDGALHLRQGRIDMFLHDGPAIAWLASQFDTELTMLLTPLTVEQLGWGLRRDDPLKAPVNAALKAMRADGFLDEVLHHWMPWIDKVRFEGVGKPLTVRPLAPAATNPPPAHAVSLSDSPPTHGLSLTNKPAGTQGVAPISPPKVMPR